MKPTQQEILADTLLVNTIYWYCF